MLFVNFLAVWLWCYFNKHLLISHFKSCFCTVPYCVAKFTSSLIRSGLLRLFDISTMITYKTINPENSAPICMSCAYIAISIKINTIVRYKGQFKYLRSFPFNFIFVFFIFTPFKNLQNSNDLYSIISFSGYNIKLIFLI